MVICLLGLSRYINSVDYKLLILWLHYTVIIGISVTFCISSSIFAIWSRRNTTKMTDKALQLAFALKESNARQRRSTLSTLNRTSMDSNKVTVQVSAPDCMNRLSSNSPFLRRASFNSQPHHLLHISNINDLPNANVSENK